MRTVLNWPRRSRDGRSAEQENGSRDDVGTVPQDRTLALYLAHRGALVNYANGIVGDRARAEDVVQEAFLRFASAREKSDEAVERPPAYLYRIVRNLAIDRQRAEAARTGEATLENLPSPSATPEQTAIDRDQLRVLAAALAELPERTRTAFNMHRLEGCSLKEIADHLGVSVVRAHQLVKDAIRHGTKRLDADD